MKSPIELDGPRVIDGLCPENCTCTAPRITNTYREGKGDKRNIVTDEGLLQDLLFGYLEELRIELLDTQPFLLNKHIHTFCDWLIQASYSISSFIHCIHKGEKVITKHTLPQNAQVYLLMSDISLWKNELGSKQEFGHYPSSDLALACRGLDSCRVKTRKIHTIYRAWRAHYEEVGGHSEELNQLGVFLNRLSTWFEWAARSEAKLRGVEIEFWVSEMPSFPEELLTGEQ